MKSSRPRPNDCSFSFYENRGIITYSLCKVDRKDGIVADTRKRVVVDKLMLKNKLLFLFCITFIMLSLFLICYIFFFRSITIDVTKNMKITYSGESGSASVEIVNEDHNMNQRIQEFLDTISYRVNPKTNLSNGTILTVQANYADEIAKKYNIQVINDTIDITVEGLAERYLSADQISGEFLTTLDHRCESYFERNMEMILQDDFTKLYISSVPKLKEKKRLYRVFMQSLNTENKDKIIDIYALTATGKINQAEDHEELVDGEETIYYIVTYDSINSSQKLKDEDVYGEKIIHGDLDLSDKEDLETILRNRYLLNYTFTIMSE